FHKVCSVYYIMGEQRLPINFNDPERGLRSHTEHVQIFEALLRRDGNLDQALMSAHLQGAVSYWKGLISGPEDAQQPDARLEQAYARACPTSSPPMPCIRGQRPCTKILVRCGWRPATTPTRCSSKARAPTSSSCGRRCRQRSSSARRGSGRRSATARA